MNRRLQWTDCPQQPAIEGGYRPVLMVIVEDASCKLQKSDMSPLFELTISVCLYSAYQGYSSIHSLGLLFESNIFKFIWFSVYVDTSGK